MVSGVSTRLRPVPSDSEGEARAQRGLSRARGGRRGEGPSVGEREGATPSRKKRSLWPLGHRHPNQKGGSCSAADQRDRSSQWQSSRPRSGLHTACLGNALGASKACPARTKEDERSDSFCLWRMPSLGLAFKQEPRRSGALWLW